MGDFSIRCAISGVPIPSCTPVLVIPLGRNADKPAYLYPLSLPVVGEMGSYGEVDDGFNYDSKGEYLHVLPELWQAAGTIWEKAMFGKEVPDFMAEIVQERARYLDTLCAYAHFKGHEGYESLIELRLGREGEWMRRLSHIVLFAPEFGKTNPIVQQVRTWITQALPPTAEEVQTLRTFIAAFMASCVTGTNLLGPDGAHPMEQYPDLACDLAWHKAIVTAIQHIRTARKG